MAVSFNTASGINRCFDVCYYVVCHFNMMEQMSRKNNNETYLNISFWKRKLIGYFESKDASKNFFH